MDYPIPIKAFSTTMHRYQQMFFKTFDEHKHRFFMLKWHRRARKTSLAINLLIRECIRNPNSVYLYVAPTYKQAKNIIWRDPNMLRKWLPDKNIVPYVQNESELFIKFANGSMIVLKGADDPDSIKGIDATGVVFDEWSLMTKPNIWFETIYPMMAQNASRWSLFLYTPKGVNHASEMWAEADDKPQWFKMTVRASQSGLIPKAELEQAKKEMPPSLYAQEMECDDLSDDELAVISQSSLQNLLGIDRLPTQRRKIIACDPATGGDECVVYVYDTDKIVDALYLHEKDSMVIVGHLLVLGQKHKCKNYIVDSIGVGKGILDQLRHSDVYVQAFISSEKATDKSRFRNKRAEAWWYVADEIRRGNIQYPADEELRKQLCAVKYKVIDSSGKIGLFAKEDTKVQLGRSPDRGDCFVYAVWGLQTVDPEQDNKTNRKRQHPPSYSQMAY